MDLTSPGDTEDVPDREAVSDTLADGDAPDLTPPPGVPMSATAAAGSR